MFTKLRSFRAFTLIEVLITLTIFVMVAIIAVTLLVNGMRSAKRIQAQIYLYTEAQALMDQIAREVSNNTVDYELYYSRNVLGETGWDTPNYGFYGQTFFNPGTGGQLVGPYDDVDDYYGANCPSDTSLLYPDECSDETPDYDELDLETGTHPFEEIDDFTGYTDDPVYMNAFCEGTAADPDHGSIDCTEVGVPFTDELFLVNGAGDTRIMYIMELLEGSSTEYGLSRLVMSGADYNNDGVEDTWSCTSDYDCLDVTGEVGEDLIGLAGLPVPDEDDFMPLSPLDIRVVSFNVLISPSEDPYRGFGEEDAQLQPQVTVIMEVTLSDEFGSSLLGDIVPSILIQRTMTTGVYSKVVSYE